MTPDEHWLLAERLMEEASKNVKATSNSIHMNAEAVAAQDLIAQVALVHAVLGLKRDNEPDWASEAFKLFSGGPTFPLTGVVLPDTDTEPTADERLDNDGAP